MTLTTKREGLKMRPPATAVRQPHLVRWIIAGILAAAVGIGIWTYFAMRIAARWSAAAPVPVRSGTEGIASNPNAAEPNASELSQAERRRIVEAAIGPAPSPDAVPVVGYTTKGGIRYPSRWRTRPDASRTNNFKLSNE